MRQADDLSYAQLLDRIRLRQFTEEDMVLLRTRLISRDDAFSYAELAAYFADLQLRDSRAMALFPTNQEVSAFNDGVMECQRLETVIPF